MRPVSCRSLASILSEHGITHVNFMSVDIEGQELRPLSVFPFQDIAIDAILVESVAPFQWALNYHLTMNGFRLEQQLHIDSLFVHRDVPPHSIYSPRKAYPDQWDENWRQSILFRCSTKEAAACSSDDIAMLMRLGRVGTRIRLVGDTDEDGWAVGWFQEEQVETSLPVAPASKYATSASGGGRGVMGGIVVEGGEGGGLLTDWRRQMRRGRRELAQGKTHPIESKVAETDVLYSEHELCDDNGCSSTSDPSR